MPITSSQRIAPVPASATLAANERVQANGRTDDERWESLAADDPVSLPRIRSALDRLGQALRALGRDSAAGA